jgi:hypothetical protein
VLVLALLVLGRHRRIRLVPYAGALVIALMLCSRILSPQYLVWAVPFATLLWAGGERQGTALFAVAAWLTAILDWGYADFVAGDALLQAAVILRNLLLVATAVLFLRAAFTDRATAPEAELVGAR